MSIEARCWGDVGMRHQRLPVLAWGLGHSRKPHLSLPTAPTGELPLPAFRRNYPPSASILHLYAQVRRGHMRFELWRLSRAPKAFSPQKDEDHRGMSGPAVLCPYHWCAFNCFLALIICLLHYLEFAFHKQNLCCLICKITWPIWKLQTLKHFICRSQLFSLADGWACISHWRK